MAPGLTCQSVRRTDKQQSEVGGRRAGRHVARVLLVAGRICHDVLTPFGCEKSVSNIDGDLLLTLGRKAVEKQGKIDLTVLIDVVHTAWSKRLELIREHKNRAARPRCAANGCRATRRARSNL